MNGMQHDHVIKQDVSIGNEEELKNQDDEDENEDPQT